MKNVMIQGGIVTPILVVLMILSAFYTPWWGTPIVAGVLACLPGLRARLISVTAFCGWFLACAIRDALNDFGPSRVFARLLSLETVGLSLDSLEARLLVYLMASFVGFALATFTVGAIRFTQSFVRAVTNRSVQNTLR